MEAVVTNQHLYWNFNLRSGMSSAVDLSPSCVVIHCDSYLHCWKTLHAFTILQQTRYLKWIIFVKLDLRHQIFTLLKGWNCKTGMCLLRNKTGHVICKLLESYVSQVIVWSVWFLLSHRIVSLSLFVNVLICLGVLVNPMLSALLQVL